MLTLCFYLMSQSQHSRVIPPQSQPPVSRVTGDANLPALYPTYYLKKVQLLECQRYPNPNESSSVTNCSNYTPIKLLQANCKQFLSIYFTVAKQCHQTQRMPPLSAQLNSGCYLPVFRLDLWRVVISHSSLLYDSQVSMSGMDGFLAVSRPLNCLETRPRPITQ